MKFDKVSIDLLFCRLAMPVIPTSLSILDEANLRNLDDQSVRSLNGCRVTDQVRF
jgi:poly(A) polymerase